MNSIGSVCKHLAWLLVLLSGVAAPAASYAGAIAFENFWEFGFDGVGFATGCAPADPAGGFCITSSGTSTSFLDTPPWTFTAPAGGATLTVTDAFEAGDRFQVFDFNANLGLTSAPVGSADCGDDPVPCLADPNISKGLFPLAPGNHSITIYSLSDFAGSGYLQVSAIPEPTTLLVFSLGGAAALLAVRRRRPQG